MKQIKQMEQMKQIKQMEQMKPIKRTIGIGLCAMAVMLLADMNMNATNVYAKTVLKMKQKKITLYQGKSKKCKLTVKPKSTNVKWISKNEWVASVSSSGKITANYPGKTQIIAKAGKVKAKCKVIVKAKTVTLNSSQEEMFTGEKVTLTAKAKPATKVTWTSSNTDIATVSKNGVVKAKREGAVTITATADDVSSSCDVTVSDFDYEFMNDNEYVFLNESKEINLKSGSDDYDVSVSYTYPKETVTIEESEYWSYNDEINPYMEVETDWDDVTITGTNPGVTTLDATITYTRWKGGKQVTETVTDRCNIYVLDEGIDQHNVIYGKGKTGVTLKHKMITGNTTGQNSDSQNTANSSTTNSNVNGTQEDTQEETAGNGTESSTDIQDSEQDNTQNEEVKNITVNSIVWSSSNPASVGVNAQTGVLSFISAGKATVTAKVTYSDGTVKQFTTNVTCTEPKIVLGQTVVAVNGTMNFYIKGANGDAEWSVTNEKKASCYNNTLSANKKGNVCVKANVDGITVKSEQIQISNPKLKSASTYLLVKGKKANIKWKGTVAKSKVTYKVEGNAVKVTNKGVIKAKKLGSATITANVDGKEFTILVTVGKKYAVKAVKTAQAIIKKSTYDRSRRMQDGYYDCSALVWKGYLFNPGLIGGNYSYAPVAADQAKYLNSIGKVVAYGPCDVDKLLPGDLIFYGSEEGIAAYNGTVGRYLNIYHVSMYAGNGERVENPVQYYMESSEIVMIARPIQ